MQGTSAVPARAKGILLPGARLLGEAIAEYVTAKKIKKQTFLNIKNGETNDTNDMTCIIFFRNLNCL